ncbi:dephospho-CoA kinase [Maricaulis salignorans]|uniref:Dephospho-CoA kinase n=1 Tax=Maricaulis salignorans TaxID=144026 RepID=A0A1G9R5E4_9PROT|nr:dephospho-CoA kinase [Maricaulis salignorans]SDM18433.1 dephospho-CoA kinase [Maricaulis salignorans]
MKIIGLTGSIGMGKSATAALMAEAGIPVFDSDASVHALYAKGGKAVGPVGEMFPGVVVDGAIDRSRLSAALHEDPSGFARLEAIVHPLVLEQREAFLHEAHERGADLVVFDIPLLFETGAHEDVDHVLVVYAPEAERRARVLQRPGMTDAKLDAIIARQLDDSSKLARADYRVETSGGLEDARRQLEQILSSIREQAGG